MLEVGVKIFELLIDKSNTIISKAYLNYSYNSYNWNIIRIFRNVRIVKLFDFKFKSDTIVWFVLYSHTSYMLYLQEYRYKICI